MYLVLPSCSSCNRSRSLVVKNEEFQSTSVELSQLACFSFPRAIWNDWLLARSNLGSFSEERISITLAQGELRRTSSKTCLQVPFSFPPHFSTLCLSSWKCFQGFVRSFSLEKFDWVDWLKFHSKQRRMKLKLQWNSTPAIKVPRQWKSRWAATNSGSLTTRFRSHKAP